MLVKKWMAVFGCYFYLLAGLPGDSDKAHFREISD